MASALPRVASVAALGTTSGAAIGRHMDQAFRALVRGGAVEATPGFLRLISGEPHPFGNFALLSAPVTLDGAAAAVDPLVAGGAPAAVMFPGLDVPADVDAYLAARGFMPPAAMPAMAVDIAAVPLTSLPDGYEFVRVGSGEDGREWEAQFAIGYEIPLAVAQTFSPVAFGADTSPDAEMQFFAIRRDGAIVGTSALYLHDGLAGIYCVSTIPDERRKGLGAHATAEALRLAAGLGYRVGILQSSDAGHGVYLKLGFSDHGGVPLYVRMPG
ncbi:MAG: GNAT family N-acetyltransferase [Vicinamibacterales bacterium]